MRFLLLDVIGVIRSIGSVDQVHAKATKKKKEEILN